MQFLIWMAITQTWETKDQSSVKRNICHNIILHSWESKWRNNRCHRCVVAKCSAVDQEFSRGWRRGSGVPKEITRETQKNVRTYSSGFLKGWLTLPLASSASNWKKTTQNVGKCITKYTESCSKETSCYHSAAEEKGNYLQKLFTWTQRNVKTYSRLTKQRLVRQEIEERKCTGLCRPGIYEALFSGTMWCGKLAGTKTYRKISIRNLYEHLEECFELCMSNTFL